LVTTTARIIAKKLIGVNIDIPIKREAMSTYRQKNPGLEK
jgi:shikimate 5-dehydrogenase